MTVPPPAVVFTHRKSAWEHRHLLFALAGRDIRARYRQSFLGIYWAVLNPLLQTLVFWLVFSRFLRMSSGTVPFVVLYFSGVIFWNFFTTAITGAMGSVATQMYLLEKHRFPAVILPLASVLARGMDLTVSAGIFGLLLAWYAMPVPVTALVILPLLLIGLAATIGISLLTAALNTLYRDVAQLVGLAFTLGFFLTPVVYDTEAVPPGYRVWLLLNPVATVIHGVRIALFRGELPSLADTWPGALASVVLLAIGWMAFRRLQSTFTEVL